VRAIASSCCSGTGHCGDSGDDGADADREQVWDLAREFRSNGDPTRVGGGLVAGLLLG
jgi:hypothetical protein